MEDKNCTQKGKVAYKSCIDIYYKSKDKEDIRNYWLYLQESKRYCEAEGVMKALELIEIIIDLNINGKTKKKNNN